MSNHHPLRVLAREFRLLAERLDTLTEPTDQPATRAALARDEAHCAQLLAKRTRELADHLTQQSAEITFPAPSADWGAIITTTPPIDKE